jgi:hypothetical protein
MATQNIFDLTDTWNNGATTFTAIKMNATDTASAAGSLLIDLQTGGVSQFSVTKAGYMSCLGGKSLASSFDFQRDSDGGEGPTVTLYHNTASPATNDIIGFVQFNSRDSAGNVQAYGDMQCRVVDATSTSEDGRIIFRTAVAGGYASRIEIAAGLYTSGATGGDQGVNTINAGAVYDDGVLLTCYVLEAWLTGGIDVVFWDALVPDRNIPAVIVEQEPGNFVEVEPARIEERRHERARGFATIAADRLDIDKFAQFLRANKRLPAFPGPEQWQTLFSGKMSTGDLLQRIWETCEVLAVHLVQARERELALEARISALENRT